MKNGTATMVDSLHENNGKTQLQANLDARKFRQNLPTLPRNYFSSSYDHLCAMQEIMTSLQVILVTLRILLGVFNRKIVM